MASVELWIAPIDGGPAVHLPATSIIFDEHEDERDMLESISTIQRAEFSIDFALSPEQVEFWRRWLDAVARAERRGRRARRRRLRYSLPAHHR